MGDVLLTYGLNTKLRHIELHNMIRRLMYTPFGVSIGGSSVLFDHFTFTKLTEENKFVRYAITSEMNKTLEESYLQKFPEYTDRKNKKHSPIKIASRGDKSYSSIIHKFPGAVVREPTPKIINDGSLVIDLDATALYPSMIHQFNVSFDSYRGRIIPPCCYKTLELLENCLGKQPFPPNLPIALSKRVTDYVDKEDEKPKLQTAITIYNILMALFDMLAKDNITIDHIYEPKLSNEAILQKTVLVPLLDVINTTHDENPKYNPFVHDYLFTDYESLKKKYPYTYILYNPNESNSFIKKHSIDDTLTIIKKYCLTYSGTFFARPEERLGLFSGFLHRMKNMRNAYKGELKKHTEGSDQYILNDNRQKSVKVVMNTTRHWSLYQ